eukprot:TRINITY_DN67251_c0_g1_i1.p1 TRINITY_DN67251_c0_g1~~TRINITY_DN67251_c0_g1_i1.p1  ORF type:complete len:324 (-),score=21.28 TRINITY_DN67251_c0_g1_i1:215-1162(-)
MQLTEAPVTPTIVGRGWSLWLDEWAMVGGCPVQTQMEVVSPVVVNPTELSQLVQTTGLPDLPAHRGVHLFQPHITPSYNDPRNRKGGHFAFRTHDARKAADLWWALAVALLTGKYPTTNEGTNPCYVILGVSVIRKPKHSCLKVWLPPVPRQERWRQRDTLISFLKLNDQDVVVKFSPHRCILQKTAEAISAVQEQLSSNSDQQSNSDPESTSESSGSRSASFSGPTQTNPSPYPQESSPECYPSYFPYVYGAAPGQFSVQYHIANATTLPPQYHPHPEPVYPVTVFPLPGNVPPQARHAVHSRSFRVGQNQRFV